MATGAPDVTGCDLGGWQGKAWTPDNAREGPEWLEVGFGGGGRARGIRIHETSQWATGFVVRVDLLGEDGTAHAVYAGGDTTPCGGWLEVRFPVTEYRVVGARVTTSAKAPVPEAIDAVGLLVQPVEGYEYNGFNQLLTVSGEDGSTVFGYDGNGNQVRKTETVAGGVGQVTQYVYDLDDRLVGIGLPNGVSNAFEYDTNGLRVRKTDSSGTSRYLLDGLSVIGQYAADGTRTHWYTQSPARIDEVLSVVTGSGKYWYQSDALGSVYTLTTAAGGVQARGGYDVFGAPVAVSGTPVGQPFGFTGREHELDAGLVYARARFLNPRTGRWDRPDPKKFVDGPNRFAYVRSQVTAFEDPLGLYATEIHAFIIGEAFSGYSDSDIDSIRRGSYDADHMSGTQGTEFAYMHAMRGPGDTYALAMAHWEIFILSALARAIVGVPTNCNSEANAMWELGFGGHALMDLYSPLHRFRVWEGVASVSAYEHWRLEGFISPTFPSVKAAIDGLKMFRGWYEDNRRSASLGFDAVLGTLMANYGSLLQAEAVWYASKE